MCFSGSTQDRNKSERSMSGIEVQEKVVIADDTEEG
jgi:hypothetical protein